MCLGKWHLFLNDKTFYVVNDPLDAFAMWLAILKLQFKNMLEQNKMINWEKGVVAT
jgi:hypothetical protein